jgi:hypothetical protein
MRYEHIDGLAVVAHFSSEGESRYRNRLEITLKDAAPKGETVWMRDAKPKLCR